tara:strand:+ start:1653 stop:2324 length:672 start_codon:yes stop_codon:yes gene_type:complete
MVSRKLFITGTNTEVGKTFVTCEMLEYLVKYKKSIAAFKPVETGCNKNNKILQPNDSKRFFKVLGKTLSLDLINPYRFIPPISPNRAIRLAKKNITLNDYCDKLNLLKTFDYILIEGAGGVCSPLSCDGLNIDFAKKVKMDSILVARDEIGVINNVILSINTFIKYKLKLKAIVLNRINPKQPRGMDNVKELRSFTNIPIIQIIKGSPTERAVKKLLNLTLLG